MAHGDSLFIAGTRTAADWIRNASIPFGGVKSFPRYQAAKRAVHAKITRVVGHSMGGSVAIALAQSMPRLSYTTYDAPEFDQFGIDSTHGASGHRYRDTLDPVSVFDGGANTIGLRTPHYAGRIDPVESTIRASVENVHQDIIRVLNGTASVLERVRCAHLLGSGSSGSSGASPAPTTTAVVDAGEGMIGPIDLVFPE